MKPLSPRAHRALRAYRSEHALPAELRVRLLANLARQGQGSPPSSGNTEPAPTTARPGGRSLLRWAGIVAGVAAVLVGVSILGSRAKPVRVPIDRVALVEPARALGEPPVPIVAPSVAREEHVLPPSAAAARVVEAHGSAHEQNKEAPVSTPARRAERARLVEQDAERSSASKRPQVARGAAQREKPAQPEDPEPSHESPPVVRTETAELPAAPAGSLPTAASNASASSVIGQRKAVDPPRIPNLLDEEVMQMRRVYDYLRAGDPLRALSALSEHARRFPEGKLSTMRQVARVQALCDLGKRAEASTEAARFLQENGDSPYAARMRQVCVPRINPPK